LQIFALSQPAHDAGFVIFVSLPFGTFYAIYYSMNRIPYVGWKDYRLFVFNRKSLAVEQDRILAPFIGISIIKQDGGKFLVEFYETAKRIGVATSKQFLGDGGELVNPLREEDPEFIDEFDGDWKYNEIDES
jgi:hypothetical protein